jgi:hypothetical protein
VHMAPPSLPSFLYLYAPPTLSSTACLTQSHPRAMVSDVSDASDGFDEGFWQVDYGRAKTAGHIRGTQRQALPPQWSAAPARIGWL